MSFTANPSFGSIPDYSGYISQAYSRFPSAIRAVDQLRKLGEPPSSFEVDRPGYRVETASQVIFALCSHTRNDAKSAFLQVQKHWPSAVYPWIALFLRSIIVLRGRDSPTPSEMDILEHALLAIPSALAFAQDNLRSLKHVFPRLQPMIAQIWLILLEKDHVFTDSWSGLLLNFAVCDRDLPVSRRPAWDPTLPLPYEIDARLGRALLGHLGARTQRLRKMDASGLDRFKTFLLVLTTGNHCFQKPNPIYLGENYNATLGLMARILKILLCKRESLRVHPVDHEESFGVYGIVTAILIGFDEILLSSVRVQHVLDSGLIRTLYFGKECYAELDKRHRMSTSPRFRGAEIRVLNRISLFLVHPIVMRSLMRGIVYFPDVLAELSAQTGLDAAIVDAWVNLFRKAEELFKIRYTLKLRGLCNYLECPISSEEASEEHLNTRYMRCLGCTLSIYCSLGCRRADWKRGHKEECPTFAQTIRNGYPPVGPNDLWIFDALVKAYISLRAERFNTKIESFRSTMEVKTRNPVLHINFDQSHLPPTEDAEIMEMEVFASRLEGKDRRKGQFCDTLREAWYRTRSDQLLILAAFPVHYGQTSFPLDTVVPFPLRPNDVETDLYGWIRGD